MLNCNNQKDDDVLVKMYDRFIVEVLIQNFFHLLKCHFQVKP